MAHTLSLVYGATTVALASGDYRVLKYVPATPEADANSITETATILITASSLANLQSDIAAINKVFDRARMFQAGKSIIQCFIKFQGSGESLTWQSEIFDGKVVLPDSALAGDWANTQLSVGVVWSRSPFWESDTWTALPLTNGNGTSITSAINVYNENDGSGASPSKKNNYVDIAAADIAGELPAPVKMVITPISNPIFRFFMGVQADIAGLGLVQPWGDVMTSGAANFIGSGTETANADSSGGYYLSLSILAGLTITLSKSIDVSAYQGGYFKFIVRWASLGTEDITFQFKLIAPEGYPVVAESAEFLNVDSDSFYVAYGDMKIYPRMFLPRSGSSGNYILTMYITNNTAGTVTPGIDFIFMMPTTYYVCIGSDNIDVTSKVVYSEGLENLLYREMLATGAQAEVMHTYQGSGIYLVPGVNNRVHFLWASGGTSSVTDKITLQMWYKPRRSTL
jgi:hypothetical protein